MKMIQLLRQPIRGFTLIELVVTISIIVLLVGMVAYVSVALAGRGDVTRTQTTLTLLDSMLQEWERASERQVSFGANATPFGTEVYEIDENALVGADAVSQSANFTDKMMQLMERPQAVKDMLVKMEPKALKRITTGTPAPPTGGWLRVVDAWDKHILAVHPGRLHVQGEPTPRDEDGTIRTGYEDRFGIAQSGRIYFVSAGPDGAYGDMSAGGGFDATQDNLYTSVPIKP